MIKWEEDYCVGVECIDEQHKQLFEIANRAYDLFKNQFITDKYDKIIETIDKLKKRIRRHHEIYLSDPRKAAPQKLKTVLRHPVVTVD